MHESVLLEIVRGILVAAFLFVALSPAILVILLVAKFLN